MAFFVPKSRRERRKLLPLKQLCIPATLKLDILKSFHESAEALFETIRQKYFWFHLYSDTLLYYRQCKGCRMSKKRTHQNKAPLHCLGLCGFLYKILVNKSGPFKTDYAGYRYCLIVTEFKYYIILIQVKSV